MLRNELLSLTSKALHELIEDNAELVRLCNYRREHIPSAPIQSNFRVYAFLIIRRSEDDALDIIEGANSEPTYIGGSICAERAAIMQLRHLCRPNLLKVVVVTDSDSAVSPGVLCREYMSSFASALTPIVMGNNDGSQIMEDTLGGLYPWPNIYRGVTSRSQLTAFGTKFAKEMVCRPCGNVIDGTQAASDVEAEVAELIQAALAVNKHELLESLHPIRYSAAVRLWDGSVLTAWQLKALEFGGDLDPVSQLVADLVRMRQTNSSNATSSWGKCHLIMVDQFGIAHSPVARARALLTEHGLGDLQVVLHADDGTLLIRPARELVPSPKGSRLLTHDDFKD